MHSVSFPLLPTSVIVHDMTDQFNNPSFDFGVNSSSTYEPPQKRPRVSLAETAVSSVHSTENISALCTIYKTKYTFDVCYAFQHKSLEDRKTPLKHNGFGVVLLNIKETLSCNNSVF